MMKYKFASHKSQITLLLLMVLLGGIKAWGQTEISSLSEITDATGSYTLASNFSTSGTPANGIGSSSTNPFKGTIDGGLVTITGTWNKPLFDYVEDATIKNVIIQEVSVSTSANAGAIAANASGATRIYNCGILGGTVGGSGNVGGLVGFLDGTSRVINCYSYANITSGSVRAGIVGYNNFASKYNNLKTMVMNCMFYGDISIGDNLYPIYGGEEISNDYKASTANRLNNYNYFLYEAPFSAQRKITKYNCALAAEKRFLVRFEFYRHLVNSTRELAAWYATGSTANAHETMAKWVYDKS
ncbi:MAG: hypothetical protein J5761_06345, partial [Paludibacteraceae bacterium]|nr:hypothetical protein [Paludibacteraceae bacterium]